MVLYNISRNVRDRVARASGVLLMCISWAYFADVLIGLEPGQAALETWFRLQWIGVALVPAAMFHLSDALLATTGLVSRGRRRRAVRVLYTTGTMFALMALFSDWLIRDLMANPVWHMRAGPWFALYVVYFISAVGFAVFNVVRAWQRCLTTYSRRRMGYLMAAFTTPAWGIFPYSLLFSGLSSGMSTLPDTVLWLVFNVANLAVLAMLAFMAYPLSFFGQNKPDRVVRFELLQFMLRGPLTGILIVVVLQTSPRIEQTVGVDSQAFVTLMVVASVLWLQWTISLLMPLLETSLIYTQEQDQALLFQEFSQQVMTRSDAEQVLEALLAAVCEQLRVPTAFVVSTIHPSGPRFEQYIGLYPENISVLELLLAKDIASNGLEDGLHHSDTFITWHNYWVLPLRYTDGNEKGALLGVLGVWARAESPNLDADDNRIVTSLSVRIRDVLTNLSLQNEIFTKIANLSPSPVDRVGLAVGRVPSDEPVKESSTPQSEIINSDEFTDLVRDALRSYWGGSKLNESSLLNLQLVVFTSQQGDGNRVNALRQVLGDAIEQLRPEGERSFIRTDWLQYNIIELRFIQGRKVREVTRRLSMSDSDFYRKQGAAIEHVAQILRDLEQAHIKQQTTTTTAIPQSFEEINY